MAFAVVMVTGALCSLNAVVRKHPKVSAAITLSVKAKIVLALDKNVFILPVTSDTTPNRAQTGSGVVSALEMAKHFS